MDKNTQILIVFGIVILIGIFFYLTRCSENKEHMDQNNIQEKEIIVHDINPEKILLHRNQYIMNYHNKKYLGHNGTTLDNFTFYTYKHTENPERIIFVLSGNDRDAAKYRDSLIELGRYTNSLIVAPEYDKEHFSPSDKLYQNGYMFDNDKTTKYLNTKNLILNNSGFSIITDIYNYISKTENNLPYYLIGHSAGGQFLSRYAAFYYPVAAISKKVILPTKIILCNAGTHFFVASPILNNNYILAQTPNDGVSNCSNDLAKYNVNYQSVNNNRCSKHHLIETFDNNNNNNNCGTCIANPPNKLLNMINDFYNNHNHFKFDLHKNSLNYNLSNISHDNNILLFKSDACQSYNGFKMNDTYIHNIIAHYLNAPIVFIQGRGDINFCGGGVVLNESKDSDAQGLFRLQRGVNAFFTGLAYAERHKLNFNWHIRITKDIIGHNGDCMLNSDEVVETIFGNKYRNYKFNYNGCCLAYVA